MPTMDFRMYVKQGCPFCEAAKAMFQNDNVPVELIDISTDPIITAGLRSLTNSLSTPIPVTVSFITNEVIKGFNQGELRRVITLYQRIGANPRDIPVTNR